MRIFEKVILVLIYLHLPLTGSQYSMASTNVESQQTIKDSLFTALKDVSTWKKKRSIYENLIDLEYNHRTERLKYCTELYYLAHQAGDFECQEQMLRELCNVSNLDSIRKYIHYTKELEKLSGRDVRATLCLLYIRKTHNITKPKEEGMAHLHKLLDQYETISLNEENYSVYDQIRILSDIAFFLKLSNAEGDFYIASMNKLQQLCESLPVDERFITANVYIRLSSLYTNQGEAHLALRADSLFLNYIHELENYYKKQHRPYRSYEMFYYQTYCRMLANYAVLTKQQIDGLYHKALAIESYITNKNQKALLRFYYNLGVKNYKKALIHLNQITDSNERNNTNAHIWLGYKILLYTELGLSRDSLVKYYADYVEKLNTYNTTQEAARLAETHILYNVDSLRSQNNRLLLEGQQAELTNKQHIIFFNICIILLLIVACVSFIYLYLNKRLYNKRLQEERNTLIQTQEQLIEAKNKAEQSEKLKSAFLANMSHEIRTPLNAIVGFSGLILETDDKAEQEEFYSIIQTNNELLLTLVNDILELAKLESGHMDSKMQEFDMTELLQQIAMTIEQRITSNDVKLLEEHPYRQCFIEADKKTVMQLIINFATNAVKYTQKGTITLSYAIQDNGLYLSVKDTGVGISEEKRQRVFDRFEKLDSFVQGTGLGLSICKAITDNLEGKIGVESQEGVGSTFWAWIPVQVKKTIA